MPVHDWSRASSNLFQHFHGQWISELVDRLNDGVLPAGYYATGQQTAGVYVSDILANRDHAHESPANASGGALLSAPPKAAYVEVLDEVDFSRRQRSILIQHAHGREVAAIIEIVSPSNKASQRKLQQFVRKAADAILQGCHLLVVDVHPPTNRDPQGLHHEIWQELGGKPYTPPPGRPLVLAAYDAVPFPVAYVEPLAAGEALRPMPLFLQDEEYVEVPLEETYLEVLRKLPKPLRAELES